MLAEGAAKGEWPEVINLPTASGKTACLDVAVFGIAVSRQKRMPRRIWFVVDRRIVVDEAFERAKKIAAKLARAREGPLKDIADLLRNASGTDRPLAVGRLRGGTWRDDGWARLPSQPAIICSTVDQVGSALLFRAYGHGDRTASIWAGLAANDSLILLDEAHCAVPFMQTLRALATFRRPPWSPQLFETPFYFTIMSATPPSSATDSVFPKLDERTRALDHPLLKQRFTVRKSTILQKVKSREFVNEATECAKKFINDGKGRVAVMVNRVAKAQQISNALQTRVGDTADIVLLTGRMRPLDRDVLVKKWESLLRAGSAGVPKKPIILVTTQCLEVGADFSFEALVTECASIDALRQRFGRLNRFGVLRDSPAVVLIEEEQLNESGDPIYGDAICQTWRWLSKIGKPATDGSIAVDFGIEAMDASLSALREEDEERCINLLAPSPDAPILLPAHLDLICQTSPRPVPDPELTMFLHGKERGAPEVRVVLRADLPSNAHEAEAAWIDILSLVPPTSPEMFTVPLYRLRRWLIDGSSEDLSGDVEGSLTASDDGASRHSSQIPFLIWRGINRSEMTRDTNRIRPDDVIVMRLSGEGLGGLAQAIPEVDGLGTERLDLAERALRQARGRVVLRVQSEVLEPLLNRSAVKSLLQLALSEADRDEIEAALRSVIDEDSSGPSTDREISIPPLPSWLKDTIELLLKDSFSIEDHSAGGMILTGKQLRVPEDTEIEDDSLADEDDLTSRSWEPVTLRQHTSDVYRVACEFAKHCFPAELASVLGDAALCHDLGKLDPRFQLLLRNGSEEAVESEAPLAKSASLPERQRQQFEVRQDFGLPKGFRHEFFSLQLAEHFGLAAKKINDRDLMLHLIASHHGYARPFAPVIPDPILQNMQIVDLSLSALGINATLKTIDRQALSPSYRLDSGVSDRFWRLTRRYGWWGLAYLEAVFRLADWYASRRPGIAKEEAPVLNCSPRSPASHRARTIAFPGLSGANPLATLAALGVLRTLTEAWPDSDVRLAWQENSIYWHPVLCSNCLPNDTVEARHFVCVALAEKLKLGLDTPEAAEAERRESQKAFEVARLRFRAKLKEIKNRKLRGSERKQAIETETKPLRALMQTKRAEWLAKLRGAVPSLEMALGQRINVPPSEFREFCVLALESGQRWVLDQLAHFGSDGYWDRKRGEIEPTPFSFVNGSGRQFFLDTARQLVSKVTVEQIEAALFEPWRPSDMRLSMRWNPSEDRRYALMAEDPTSAGNEPRTIWAANLLGYVGLGLLPSAPLWQGLGTVGMAYQEQNASFRWPIWTAFLSAESVTSLLASPDFAEHSLKRDYIAGLGIRFVFQSERIEVGDGANIKINFTPSRAL
jgi:CRISPR-associated endonuclease/helicase Cas3